MPKATLTSTKRYYQTEQKLLPKTEKTITIDLQSYSQRLRKPLPINTKATSKHQNNYKFTISNTPIKTLRFQPNTTRT